MRIVFLLIVSLTASIVNLAAASEPGQTTSEQNQSRFIKHATGVFSNLHQVASGSASASAPAILMSVNVVTKKGKSWLEVIHKDFRGERQLLRHQLLSVSPAETGVMTSVYYLPEESHGVALFGSDAEPATWIEQQDAELLTGCDITWTAVGDSFQGSRTGESCYFYDAAGQRVRLTSNLELSEEGWFIQDTAIALEPEYLPASVAGDTIEFKPIRFFKANIEFHPAGLDEPVSVELKQPLHDHGQRVQLYSGEMALPFQLSVTSVSEHEIRLHLHSRNHQEETQTVEAKLEDEKWKAKVNDLRLSLSLR